MFPEWIASGEQQPTSSWNLCICLSPQIASCFVLKSCFSSSPRAARSTSRDMSAPPKRVFAKADFMDAGKQCQFISFKKRPPHLPTPPCQWQSQEHGGVPQSCSYVGSCRPQQELYHRTSGHDQKITRPPYPHVSRSPIHMTDPQALEAAAPTRWLRLMRWIPPWWLRAETRVTVCTDTEDFIWYVLLCFKVQF